MKKTKKKTPTLMEQVQMHEEARNFLAGLLYVMRRVGLDDDDMGPIRIKPAGGIATSAILAHHLFVVMRLETESERAVTVRCLRLALKEFQPKAKRR